MKNSIDFWRKQVICLWTIAFLAGCAGFVKHENPEAEDWQGIEVEMTNKSGTNSGSASSGPNVFVSQSWTVLLDQKNVRPAQNSDYFLPRNSEDLIAKTLTESRMVNITLDRKTADYQFVFENQLETEANFGNVYLSALTFFIIPQIGTTRHAVKLSILDRGGSTIREFKAGDSVKHLSQILLLPFMPFSSSGSAERAAYIGSLRLMFQELKKSKILSLKP